MEEEIVILISNVFSPQKKKNNPVIQKERIKTRKSAHVFLLLVNRFWGEGRSLTDLVERHIYSTSVQLLSSVFDSLQSSLQTFFFLPFWE